MADFNPDDLNDAIESLIETLNKFNSKVADAAKSRLNVDNDYDKRRIKSMKTWDKLSKDTTDNITHMNWAFGKLGKDSAKSLKDHIAAIEESINAIDKQREKEKEQGGDRKEIYEELTKKQKELQNALKDSKKALTDAGRSFSEVIKKHIKGELTAGLTGVSLAAKMTTKSVVNLGVGITKIGAVIGDVTKGLLDSGSATSVSQTVFRAGLDTAGKAGSTFGDMLSRAGDALLIFGKGGYIKLVGLALEGLGIGVKTVSEGASKLGGVVLETTVKELEKTIKTYRSMAGAGATFTGGMTEMRDSAYAAGFTLQQFGEIATKSGSTLSILGVGVTEGLKMIGKSTQIMKQEGTFDQLLQLGYGFQEIGELQAEVIADMSRQGAGQTVTKRMVAEETARYAENLRIISSITGEDAKKKMQEARDSANELAFRQKLAGKTAKEQQDILEAMAVMPAIQRKNFKELVVFGSVVNKEGAIYASNVQGAAAKQQEQLAAFHNGTLGLAKENELSSKYNKQIRESILNDTRGLAMAAMSPSGAFKDVAALLGEVLDSTIKITKKSVDAANDQVTGMKSATDALTTGVRDAAHAAQKMAQDVEKVFTDSKIFNLYTKMTVKMFDIFKNAVVDPLMHYVGAVRPGEAEDDGFFGSGIGMNEIATGAAVGSLGYGAGKKLHNRFGGMGGDKMFGSAAKAVPSVTEKTLQGLRQGKGLATKLGSAASGAVSGGASKGILSALTKIGGRLIPPVAIGLTLKGIYDAASEYIPKFLDAKSSAEEGDAAVKSMMSSSPVRARAKGYGGTSLAMAAMSPSKTPLTDVITPDVESNKELVKQLASLIDVNKNQTEKLEKSIEMLRDKNSSQLEELIRLFDRNVGYSKNIVDNQ